MTRITQLTIVLLLHGFTIFSQPNDSLSLSTEALMEDFTLLRNSMESTHAGLYTYTSKSKLDEEFQLIESQLTSSMSSIEFYRIICELNKSIKNSHTRILPSYLDKKALKEELLLFPLEVYWKDDSLYVLKNGSNNKILEPGTLIQSINGVKASEVFNHMVSLWSRDGDNKTGPEMDMMKNFKYLYSYFIGNPETFNLEIIDLNGFHSSVNIDALLLKEIDHNLGNLSANKNIPSPLLLFETTGNTAIMTIKSFSNNAIKKADQKFKRYIKESFKSIDEQEIEHLIIDVRNNGGGDDHNVIKLFQHLYDSSFVMYDSMKTSFKKLQYKKHYTENLFLFNLFNSMSLKQGENGYNINRLGNEGLLKPKKPANNVYQGKVYILTNGNSYSASGFMASLIKNYERGLVIGEETGGSGFQCGAGSMIWLVLPNSGIKVLMPLVLLKLDVDKFDLNHGVIPDHIIVPEIDDMIHQKDPVLDFVFEKIVK